jgi:hypothetical protein
VRAFTGSTSAPRHLAFLALTRLRAAGWEVDKPFEYPGYDEETGYCLCGCCRHGI